MGPGHMGGMGMGYGFFSNLDLSDQQRTAIRDIRRENRPQQFALRDKMSELRDQLRTLYKDDKPDAKKVSEVYKKIFDLRQQQIELGINVRNKTYDVLSKKQKNKLKELQSSYDDDYRSHRGMYGRGMHHMMDY